MTDAGQPESEVEGGVSRPPTTIRVAIVAIGVAVLATALGALGGWAIMQGRLATERHDRRAASAAAKARVDALTGQVRVLCARLGDPTCAPLPPPTTAAATTTTAAVTVRPPAAPRTTTAPRPTTRPTPTTSAATTTTSAARPPPPTTTTTTTRPAPPSTLCAIPPVCLGGSP